MSKRIAKLRLKIQNAPVDPGCYLFKNSSHTIIYIGKAINLHKRVKSYFSEKVSDPKTVSMVAKVADVEYIVTHSEVEALILENTLVKKHKPRYNVVLRDDKTFPYVRITNERFPRIFITRHVKQDGSRYFGPYTNASSLKRTFRIIKKLFPIRTCKYNLDEETVRKGRIRLCLNYHIQKCEGPCQGLVSEQEYNDMIAQVEAFLNGDTAEVGAYFKAKMDQASRDLAFERAAKYRDSLQTIREYNQRQSVELTDFKDRDLINIVVEAEYGCAVLFRIRKGKLIDREVFFLEGVKNSQLSEIMRNYIQQYYSNTKFIPPEIMINAYPLEKELLQNWLSQQRGKRVKLIKPVQLEKRRLMEMAQKNACLQIEEYLLKKREQQGYVPKTLLELQQCLGLSKLPYHIEAFDISNIQGKYAVGSLITFINGVAKKSEYRRYRVKTVKGVDDYAMLAEVVQRRYKRCLKEKSNLPDLILVDGGKGQLSAANAQLEELGLGQIPIIGLAKRLEEIVLPHQKESLILPKDSLALILLQKIRDETHRFAITYHRKLREKSATHSILDDIPGLGKEKKQALLKHFKSVAAMKGVSPEELRAVKGIGPKLAKNIWICLHAD